MQLKIKKLEADAQLPAYATEGAACFDIRAWLTPSIRWKGVVVGAGMQRHINTGLAFEVPEGHVMLVYSRSGHGFKNQVRLSNSVGVIDSDYRGELLVSLHCDSSVSMLVNHGDRIAQAMILPVPLVELVEAQELSETVRGANGGGSTGVK